MQNRIIQSGQWDDKGHINRIFSVHFTKFDPNVLISGGWDNNCYLWDVRAKNCVGSFHGPNICGDTIDTLKDGSIMTGAYRDKN